MKAIQVFLYGQTNPAVLLFRDHALADAAYEAVKAALATHREHGNDKSQTVSIKGDGGAEATIKLSHVAAIGIEEPSVNQDIHIENAKLVGAVRAAHDEAKEKRSI